MNLTVTVDSADLNRFLVRFSGELENPVGLHKVLGTRLADEFITHFRARNSEPNKMGAPKTNYWAQIAASTSLGQVDAAGATVIIGDQRFAIQLHGGTITPTGGRKFLTIPLIPAARGKLVSEYEANSGNKLIRPGRAKVLMERSDQGNASTLSARKFRTRTSTGYRDVTVRARSLLRPVYALAESVTLQEDPRALPDRNALAAALQEEGNEWLTLISNQR